MRGTLSPAHFPVPFGLSEVLAVPVLPALPRLWAAGPAFPQGNAGAGLWGWTRGMRSSPGAPAPSGSEDAPLGKKGRRVLAEGGLT